MATPDRSDPRTSGVEQAGPPARLAEPIRLAAALRVVVRAHGLTWMSLTRIGEGLRRESVQLAASSTTGVFVIEREVAGRTDAEMLTVLADALEAAVKAAGLEGFSGLAECHDCSRSVAVRARPTGPVRCLHCASVT